MNLPDPIEIAEASAERWADEHVINKDFLCSCGKLCPLQDGQTISENPYAQPYCPDCFGEWWNLHFDEEGEVKRCIEVEK